MITFKKTEMSNSSKIQKIIFGPQILSALIWAFTIIACSQVSDRSHISTILITAAGFHVIMMTRFRSHKIEVKN